jgi:hypothetical protein
VEEIIIDIDERGNVRIEGKGFSGPDCVKFTEELENALGTVEKRELKPEYRHSAPLLRKARA